MNSERPKSSPVILALDVDTQTEALTWVDRLSGHIDIFKVGLQLFSREGFPVVSAIIQKGKRVFVDLKLHDIPNTVSRAVRALAVPGVDFITLHASGGSDMLGAAVTTLKDVKSKNPKVETRLLSVTVLTSFDESDLREIGVDHSVAGQVLNLARLAKATGVDGLVASPNEVQILRREIGSGMVLVTPGVRLAGTETQDQKRVMTPQDALKAGSDFLVMGRSLLDISSPEQILNSLRK